MDYYLGTAGGQEGPVAEDEVRRRIALGTLGGPDLCWVKGWPDWRKVRDVFPETFPSAAPPAVPAPPATDAPAGAVGAHPDESTPAPFATEIPAAPTPADTAPAVDPAPPVAATVHAAPITPAATARTSGMAIWSLVLGVVGCFFGLPSIVLGHLARSEIRKSGGSLTGSGLALAGLILGYAWIPLTIILVAAAFMHKSGRDFEGTVYRSSAVELEELAVPYDASQGKLRQIAQACLIHAYRHGGRLPRSVEEIRDGFGDQFAAVMDLPHTPEIESAGYLLVPGVTTSRPLTTVIAFESRPRADGSRAVAYLNGRIAVVADGDALMEKWSGP